MLRAVSTASDYLGAYAWASLPAAASWAGYRARVTDYGVNLIVISDGTRWVPAGIQTLGRSAVASSVTGTASETTLATVVVPAGLLGVNGALRISSLWSMTNNANAKTLRYKAGASTYFQGAGASNASLIDPGQLIRQRNAVSVQVSRPNASVNLAGMNGNAVTVSGTDFSTDQSLLFTGQLGVTTDTITLEQYLVEVMA